LYNRKGEKMKNTVLKVRGKDYTLEMIRYVSYTFTDRFWVYIKKNNGDIVVELTPMNNQKIDEKKLKKEFFEKLEEEKKMQKIIDENIKLREFIIKNSFNYQPPKPSDGFLTKEEEEELERLIKEVEEELKGENMEGLDDIKKTWEEKHSKNKN
jgi:His-Xaa-Ser system protein HxsD